MSKTEVGHGDSRMYQRGCHCDPCRQANTQRLAEWRGRVKGSPPPGAHGSPHTYTNYACRCAECTEAWRVDTAQRRAKARA